ncbi:tRNA(Ile)-lysidine synthase [Marinobacterium nitratireducens]|uniref:tRNA(Ile)-lysidine synthase n=1 Tax=Marinobacterium nitratireducens TaxID=518897 RepID=A0A917Z9T1_9GAMM|nr:tRNA lysidine(34) synthetase TilS [Marinobacterium nitratireducens]GGO78866.1 tRNA(Ile)-lysidine synthase [Marinobacterium nitratireducens]
MGPDALLSAFRRQLGALPCVRRWLIGFSGGLDSRVLAELAARTLDPGSVLLLHVNHHLQDGSDAWAQHCRQIAGRLGLAIRVLDVSPRSASEDAAREARYGAFARELLPGDCLLLGHHADDQAETLLLRLLRGAGVRGMRGIPRRRPLGEAELLRPLLDQTRAGLEAWARAHELDWIEDPSNAVAGYDRNYLRLTVMPELAARWPDAAQRMAQSARHLAEADELLAELARSDRHGCRGRHGGLDTTALRELSLARRRNLLRHWCEAGSGVALNDRLLAAVDTEVLGAAVDRQPQLALGDQVLRRYRDELFLVPKRQPASAGSLADIALVPGEIRLLQGRLSIRPSRTGGLRTLDGLSLRYRREGERCRPAGRGGSHPLKKLFQEAAVPPWLREGWPLLVRGDEIVAVPGLFVCEGWQVGPDEDGFVLEWLPAGTAS